MSTAGPGMLVLFFISVMLALLCFAFLFLCTCVPPFSFDHPSSARPKCCESSKRLLQFASMSSPLDTVCPSRAQLRLNTMMALSNMHTAFRRTAVLHPDHPQAPPSSSVVSAWIQEMSDWVAMQSDQDPNILPLSSQAKSLVEWFRQLEPSQKVAFVRVGEFDLGIGGGIMNSKLTVQLSFTGVRELWIEDAVTQLAAHCGFACEVVGSQFYFS